MANQGHARKIVCWRLFSAREELTTLKWHMGYHATEVGARSSGLIFGRSRQVAKYWETKVTDQNFHCHSFGGSRRVALIQNRDIFLRLVSHVAAQRPSTPYHEYRRIIRDALNVNVSVYFIRSLVAELGLSWQRPEYRQINKYTPENLVRYQRHLDFIVHVPLSRLKFLDESHFNSRGLRLRRALAPRGRPARILAGGPISASLSITLITSLNPDTSLVCWDHREGSNTQLDFIQFLLNAITVGFINRGDVLVMDNAAVHVGGAHRDLLEVIMDQHGFRIVTLPTYSPELNPCELVFGFVKNFLSSDAALDISHQPLTVRITEALRRITVQHMRSWYIKCMRPTCI